MTFTFNDITAAHPLNILRDGAFAHIGKMSTRAEKLIVPLTGAAYLDAALANPNIVGFITTEQLASTIPESHSVAISDNPKKSIIDIHEWLYKKNAYPRQAKSDSVIDASSAIDQSASIAKHNVRIGAHCTIGANVSILPHVSIGDHVSIAAGTTIGTDSFDATQGADGWPRVIHQAGGVNIGNHVTIQANCSISRATFAGNTTLCDGVMLDNMVHVAHDVLIGAHTKIAAKAMIAGAVSIGEHVWIGPAAVISNALTIEDNASITLGAVVTQDISKNARMSGHFAIDHKRFIAFMKSIR